MPDVSRPVNEKLIAAVDRMRNFQKKAKGIIEPRPPEVVTPPPRFIDQTRR